MRKYAVGSVKDDWIKYERDLEHWRISVNCTQELFEINLVCCKGKVTNKQHGLYLLTHAGHRLTAYEIQMHEIEKKKMNEEKGNLLKWKIGEERRQ